MKYYFIILNFIILSLIISANALNAADPWPLASSNETVKEINQWLEEEKKCRGSFIDKIIQDLGQCSDGELVFLNSLTLKSSYWWDKEPARLGSDGAYCTSDKSINQKKHFLIDRESKSPAYDREGPSQCGSNWPEIEKHCRNKEHLINSWDSVNEKLKFFKGRTIGEKKTIKNIVDYTTGCPYNKRLDTYPSVFQLMRAEKELYQASAQKQRNIKKSSSFSIQEQEIVSKNPQDVIKESLKVLFNTPYYLKFSQQNHPLSRIVQDHLKKLMKKVSMFYDEPEQSLDGDKFNAALLYKKILSQIERMIKYMAAFEIDMDKKICYLPNLSLDNPYYLYVQFYEVIYDLLYIFLNVSGPYSPNQVKEIHNNTYKRRIPVINELVKDGNIGLDSYPMRSGMDAFANAAMSVGHVPENVSIADKVSGLGNRVYFEIGMLVNDWRKKEGKEIYDFISLARDISQKELQNFEHEMLLEWVSQTIESNPVRWLGNNENDIDEENDKLILDIANEFVKRPLNTINKIKFYCNIKASEDLEGWRQSVRTNLIQKAVDKIKSLYNHKTVFTKIYIGNKVYLTYKRHPDKEYEINRFITNNKKQFSYAVDFYTVDNQLTTTSGMTTDTIDPGRDPASINKLYERLTNIITIKRYLNSSKNPFIFVWDTTLEIDQGPCYDMLEKFKDEIKAGRVIFILVKSLQKYANLGIGKTKAGLTTVLGHKDATKLLREKLSVYGRDVWKKHGLEIALMSFFYDRGDSDEFLDNEAYFYNSIAKHAKTINKDLSYQISGGCLFIQGEVKGDANVPWADTFGFAIPTYVDIGMQGVHRRFSVGLNPKGLN